MQILQSEKTPITLLWMIILEYYFLGEKIDCLNEAEPPPFKIHFAQKYKWQSKKVECNAKLENLGFADYYYFFF